MKKIIAILCLALLSACAVPIGQPTPAQIVAQVCPPSRATIIALQTMAPQFTVAQQVQLLKATAVVGDLCAVGATANLASLQSFAASTMPTVLALVDASPWNATDKTNITIGLIAVNVAISSIPIPAPAVLKP